jgi:thiazole tautomerase (transcriptional regulator TenI)
MLVTGRELLPPAADETASLAAVVQSAVRGGVDRVQIREKDLLPDELAAIVVRLRKLVPSRVQLVINGALGEGADGVHFPEWDMERPDFAARARQVTVWGGSVHSVGAAVRAARLGASYLVVGSIFPTPSHPREAPRGPGFLSEVCRAVSVPVLAIGGITPQNSSLCLDCGAAGVAVRSSIMEASSPEAAARQYRLALDRFWDGNDCIVEH